MENPLKIPSFYCVNCDYITNNKKDYNKHLTTSKHKNRTFLNKEIPKNLYKFICKKCEKKYKARNSLWYHEQKCNTSTNITEKEKEKDTTDKDLIMLLVKQNTDLLEVIKNGTHTTTNNTNSHNKTFNLQIFLNETCKDAMNITDFVENIKIQLNDLIKLGEIGYVDGISNIITSNLQALDITQRPIHCTDKKRETLYVKEDDEWKKEDEEKSKVRNVIKTVSNKNIKAISQFKEKYPDCKESNSKYSEQYNKLLVEIMGGDGENMMEKENNIIKNISKNVIVDK